MENTCRIPIGLTSRMAAGFFCLLLFPAIALAQCPPSGQTQASLQELKKSDFLVKDNDARQALALSMLPCLASTDPVLRDGIAFEALSFWLRKEQLSAETRLQVLERLQANVEAKHPDKNGFLAPFSILVLSEVARTDRIKPWMSVEQRNHLVTLTADYISAVRDYRGFDEKQGWRHGVAHASDLAMQLALNPAVDKPQLDLLLDATSGQIAPATHSYIYGEPERLLRPVLYIAKRDLHGEQEWQAWMDTLMQPAPLAKWDDAFSSSAGLARRHNLQSFLLLLHANTLQAENKSWLILNRLSLEALKKLP